MDTNQILHNINADDVINHLAEKKLPLYLALPYKGMALPQELHILDIREGQVTIQAPDQRVNLPVGDFVFLHSQEISQTIAARLTAINLPAGQLKLSELGYLDTPWKDRSEMRVEPKDPIMVDVRSGSIAYRACMENLSLNGIGLLVYKVIERGIPLEPQQKVLLEFELPGVGKRLMLRGVIANLHLCGDVLVRIGVKILTSTSKKNMLQRYILRRKKEILEEMERFSLEDSRYPSVVNLYF